jgi:MoCo/4Fe-4S cofactor protein with predicted Tat translocation signal
MELTQSQGKKYWRSLEELAEGEEFRQLLSQQYPRGAAALDGAMSRRRFLQLIGASMALAGLAGCTANQPNETIVPYVRQPEGLIPGVASYYATAMILRGYALGILAESHEGRPTKIEGNPDHPASLGATDPYAQALVLELYDPDRSKYVLNAGQQSSWDQFAGAIGGLANSRLRILTGGITSPSLAAQIEATLAAFPGSRWHRYEPVGNDNALEGARLAFGRPAEAFFDLTRAAVIVSLDADFLHEGPATVRYGHDFVEGRRVGAERQDMNRLYVVESTSTITGGMADHRWAVRPSQVEGIARALAAALGVPGAAAGESAVGAAHIEAIARDLQSNSGRSVIMAGEHQAPAVHALVHAMNAALGNHGATVTLIEPLDAGVANEAGTISELVGDMNGGNVDTLLILGGNPVYDAPADLGFVDALAQVSASIHLGLYPDETARRCTWHIPEAHSLESWGDARAYDGTVTIVQPLVAPFWAGRTKAELLAALTGDNTSAYDAVRAYWADNGIADDVAWRTALHDGIVLDTAASAASFTVSGAGDWLSGPSAAAGGDLEAVFVPDPSVYDGRFANNGWLQELPKPITKLTWENAALVSKATADRLGLVSGDVVDLTLNGRTVRGPVYVTPGHPDDTVTLPLGYGREAAGKVGNRAGFNVYQLRTSDRLGHAPGLQLSPAGSRTELAQTQLHFNIDDRNLVQTATLAEFREHPDFIHERIHHPEASIYPEWEYKGHAWGMAIDMNTCIGCNACVVACVAENNIPVVGKDQVLVQREMHWLRIDTYFEGDASELNPVFQPMLCQHCENAPCEYVCPVMATAHSSEGLNDMVYNRCVGTRYCSNNCPYKVRRFNFLQFADWNEESLKPLRNPDVTVRSRGVMEKCTFCVQRIEEARSVAQRDGRSIQDGEVVTACQQACPTRAIVFGDINDPNSAVSRLKAQPQNYGVLTYLNTEPRTTYLARFSNPNSEIGAEAA